MTPPRLAFDAISHRYGSTPILDGVSFAVPAARFVAVIGPSGCGKSTLLQMAAGPAPARAGRVRQRRHPGRRRAPTGAHDLGFVPQQAQLLPWKTLADNVAFPLVLRGVAAAERRRRVEPAHRGRRPRRASSDHYPVPAFRRHAEARRSIARTLVYRPET